MTSNLLQNLFWRTTSAFQDEARDRGLSARVARALEEAAYELFPERALDVFDARKKFEQVAAHAVTGEAGNLELSYGLVDDLASAVEALGLARVSDRPDPFRRVWIVDARGDRMRGVVLRCEQGEVAVLCPPNAHTPGEIGHVFSFEYRGFESSVTYDLALNDSVRLPGALVLHLNRPSNLGGEIGREQQRHEVRLHAQIRALGDLGSPEWQDPRTCTVLDVSLGGMRIASDIPYGRNHAVELELPLDEHGLRTLALPGIIAWSREDPEEGPCQGLELEGLLPQMQQAYEDFIATLEG